MQDPGVLNPRHFVLPDTFCQNVTIYALYRHFFLWKIVMFYVFFFVVGKMSRCTNFLGIIFMHISIHFSASLMLTHKIQGVDGKGN